MYKKCFLYELLDDKSNNYKRSQKPNNTASLSRW